MQRANKDNIQWVNVNHSAEVWKRPVRVTSKEHNITEWDEMGDKNYDYYSGSRVFRTSDAVTQPQTSGVWSWSSWLQWMSGTRTIDSTASTVLHVDESKKDPLLPDGDQKQN